jgi:branched-chain amino acid transport system substrate-binding protein
MEASADAGAAFINEHLGGVDGHPIEFVTCLVQVEEDGQKCGAQLLEAKVPVGLFPIGVVGNSSLYETIKGRIPLIDSVTVLPQDTTTENVYNFAGGAPAILYAKAADAAEVAGKDGNVAILEVENEGGKYSAEEYTVPTLELLGVEHSEPVYFSEEATTPEMVSALQAAGGTSASIILLDPSAPQQCNSLYEAMSQLGISETPVSATSICGAPSFVEGAAGGNPEGWRLWGFVLSSFLTSNPEVKAYIEIMEADEQGESEAVGFSNTVMRDMMLLAQFANNLGAENWTPEGFKEQILAYEGKAFLAPGPMNCSKPAIPEQPGLCGKEAIGTAFNNGTWEVIEPIPFNPAILKH